MVKKKIHLLVGLVAALALAVAGTGLSLAPAWAAGFGPAGPGGGAPANKPVLTVHKYTTPAESENNGHQVTPSRNQKPVQGVEYTVYQVTKVGSDALDMNTNKGWKLASSLQKQFAANPSLDTLGGTDKYKKFKTMTTGPDGSAKFAFPDNQRGLYVVVESSTRGAMVDRHPTHVVGSKPFMVAVPMTDQDNLSKLLWDVHAYPKNAEVSATKSVDSQNVHAVGEDVTYTVTSDIPAATGTDLDKYVVIDKYPATHLQYKRVASITVKASASTMLSESSDYSVKNSNGVVKVTFTTTGLKKLEKVRGDKLETKFTFTVLAVGSTDGTIENIGYVAPGKEFSDNPDHPSTGGEGDGSLPPIPTNKVTEKFAKIVVTKKGEGGAQLAGATFHLEVCDTKEPISVGNSGGTYTTTKDGTVTIDGVRLSDWYDGKTQATHQKYCLVEVTAPAGYELLPEPIQLDVTADHVNHGVFNVEVTDTKHNAGYHLPLTGSNAAILLGVVGVLIVAGGVVLAIRRRRDS